MTFAVMTNLVTILFCAAVLVQSMRMMRSLKVVRREGLAEVAAVVDRVTGEARMVLQELKGALADCETSVRQMADGKAMVDELTVMIGIANASADHMTDAANAARRARMEDTH